MGGFNPWILGVQQYLIMRGEKNIYLGHPHKWCCVYCEINKWLNVLWNEKILHSVKQIRLMIAEKTSVLSIALITLQNIRLSVNLSALKFWHFLRFPFTKYMDKWNLNKWPAITPVLEKYWLIFSLQNFASNWKC